MTSETLPKPAEDIFYNRRSFLVCRDAFIPYLKNTDDAITMHDRMDITLQLSRCEIEIGNIYEGERLLKECEDHILANGDERQIACIHNIRAHIYMMHADYEQGIAAALKGLYLFQQLDLPFYVMNSNVVCGHLCSQMNLYMESIDYLTAAHATALQMGDRRQAIICTMNLNDVRMNILPVEECINVNKDLLPSIKELYSDAPSYVEAGTYLQLAHLYFKAGDMKAAQRYVDQSMSVTMQLKHIPAHHLQYLNLFAVKAEIAGAADDEKGVLEFTSENTERAKLAKHFAAQVDALFFLTRFYIKRGDLVKAKAHLDEAESMIQEDDRSAMYLNLNETKCLYYNAIGDSVGELAHFKLIYEYKMKTQQEALSNRVKYMSTVYELALKKKEVEQHKAELDHKTQELNMSTYYLQQRNMLLTDLKDDIEEEKKINPRFETAFKKISKTIDRAFTKEEEEKSRIREKFDETNKAFIVRLHQVYPDLSPTECRLCALLKSGFNTKEISNLLSTSIRNVENHRTRIRKKLGLSKEDNLNLRLTEIV